MRSTDGLRPKIGRVTKPAEQSIAPQRVVAPQSKLKNASRSLVRQGGESAVLEAPLDEAVGSRPAPAFGLNRGGAATPPASSGNSDDDIDWDRVASISKFLLLPAVFAILIVIVGVKLC